MGIIELDTEDLTLFSNDIKVIDSKIQNMESYMNTKFSDAVGFNLYSDGFNKIKKYLEERREQLKALKSAVERYQDTMVSIEKTHISRFNDISLPIINDVGAPTQPENNNNPVPAVNPQPSNNNNSNNNYNNNNNSSNNNVLNNATVNSDSKGVDDSKVEDLTIDTEPLTEVIPSETVETPEPVVPVAPVKEETGEEGGKGFDPWWTMAGIAGVAGLGGVAAAAVSANSNKEEKEKEKDTEVQYTTYQSPKYSEPLYPNSQFDNSPYQSTQNDAYTAVPGLAGVQQFSGKIGDE